MPVNPQTRKGHYDLVWKHSTEAYLQHACVNTHASDRVISRLNFVTFTSLLESAECVAPPQSATAKSNWQSQRRKSLQSLLIQVNKKRMLSKYRPHSAPATASKTLRKKTAACFSVSTHIQSSHGRSKANLQSDYTPACGKPDYHGGYSSRLL